MGFFLQIIYLNGSVLKLFTSWVSFYTIRRFSVERIFRNGDTWHGLGSDGLSGATRRDDLLGTTTRAGLPDTSFQASL